MTEVLRHPGPQIWIQGDPPEIEEVLPFGITGIITNNLILRDMTRKYGQLRDLLKRYLDMTDKPVIVEVDGDTVDDYLYAAEAAYSLSPQVIIKVVTKPVALRAMPALRRAGVRMMATTVFSLNQAVVMALAGAQWIAPFVGPTQQWGEDAAMRLVREIVEAFRGRPNAPTIIAGIVRSAETAYLALAAGADGIVIFPDVYWKMLEHPGTTEWNRIFRDAWGEIEKANLLEGFVRKPVQAAR